MAGRTRRGRVEILWVAGLVAKDRLGGKSQVLIAQKRGISKTTVSRYLALVAIGSVGRNAFLDGKITLENAERIVKLPSGQWGTAIESISAENDWNKRQRRPKRRVGSAANEGLRKNAPCLPASAAGPAFKADQGARPGGDATISVGDWVIVLCGTHVEIARRRR